MSATDESAPPYGDDGAAKALYRLTVELDRSLEELQDARRRAETLLKARQFGRTWREIIASEDRPLLVGSISTVLTSLSTVGGAWRRHLVGALVSEGVSINRIAVLFGVTRQRIYALRERDLQTAVPEP